MARKHAVGQRVHTQNLKMSEVINPVLQEVVQNEVQIYRNLILVVYSVAPVLLFSHHAYCVVFWSC